MLGPNKIDIDSTSTVKGGGSQARLLPAAVQPFLGTRAAVHPSRFPLPSPSPRSPCPRSPSSPSPSPGASTAAPRARVQADTPDIQLVLTRLSGNPDLFVSLTLPVPTDAAATPPHPNPYPYRNRNPNPDPNPGPNPNPDRNPDPTQVPTSAASCVAPSCWSSTDAEGDVILIPHTDPKLIECVQGANVGAPCTLHMAVVGVEASRFSLLPSAIKVGSGFLYLPHLPTSDYISLYPNHLDPNPNPHPTLTLTACSHRCSPPPPPHSPPPPPPPRHSPAGGLGQG